MVYNPLDSIHRDKALMHMQKDAPNLPSHLQSFFTDVESLNNSVGTLETLVNNTISNAFRKNPEAIIPEYYRYYFERVRDVAMSVWNQVLNENPRNVGEAIKNLTIEDLRVEMHDNIIRLRGFLVGEGNDEEKATMRNIVFNKIIKNETIIEQILDLNSRRPALNTRMNAIKHRANEISSKLENGTISRIKCCPTIWNLIEKYVL